MHKMLRGFQDTKYHQIGNPNKVRNLLPPKCFKVTIIVLLLCIPIIIIGIKSGVKSGEHFDVDIEDNTGSNDAVEVSPGSVALSSPSSTPILTKARTTQTSTEHTSTTTKATTTTTPQTSTEPTSTTTKTTTTTTQASTEPTSTTTKTTTPSPKTANATSTIALSSSTQTSSTTTTPVTTSAEKVSVTTSDSSNMDITSLSTSIITESSLPTSTTPRSTSPTSPLTTTPKATSTAKETVSSSTTNSPPTIKVNTEEDDFKSESSTSSLWESYSEDSWTSSWSSSPPEEELEDDAFPEVSAEMCDIKDTDSSGLKLPSAIIIGSQKEAIRGASAFLSEHPGVYLGAEKFYFESQFYKKYGLRWYSRNFRRAPQNKLIIDQSSTYLDMPCAKHRIKAMNGNIIIIAVLTDPVDRVLSSLDDSVFDGDDHVDVSSPLVQSGMYALHLKRWLSVFPQSQVLILDEGDFRDNPSSVLQDIEEILGLKKFFTESMFSEGENGTSCISMKKNVCAFPSSVSFLKGVSRSLIRKLESFYEKYDIELKQLTGRKFSWML